MAAHWWASTASPRFGVARSGRPRPCVVMVTAEDADNYFLIILKKNYFKGQYYHTNIPLSSPDNIKNNSFSCKKIDNLILLSNCHCNSLKFDLHKIIRC